jgi:hypothetical protein
MEELFACLVWLFVDVLLIRTGRVVVAVASCGRWRGEDSTRGEGRVHGPAGALSFKREGQRVLTPMGLLLVGVAFYLAMIASTVAALA